MKIIQLTIWLVFCGFTNVCQAEDFSYTYLDGEYYRYDQPDLGVKIDGGVAVSGAVALTEQFHMLGGYRTAELETFFGNVDVRQLRIGAGLHTSLTEATDLVAEGALIRITTEAGGSSESETGHEISVAFRQKLSKQLEGNLNLSHTKVADLDVDESALGIGGLYHFNKRLAAGMHYYKVDGNDDFFKLSLRLSFL